MKLSDVIHFYIGQKFIHTDDYLTENEFILTGNFIARWNENCRLLLRPLSSMTEEEAKEFIVITWNIDKAALIELKITPYGIEFCDALTHLHHAASFSEISPEEFIYLIRNNFDVFSLIESQQAIDIPKLNKNEQSF